MFDRIKNLISLLLLTACVCPAFSAGPAMAGGVVAYRNATIETVSKKGAIVNGTVVVSDGKIVSVGDDVDVPTNARIVDASGLTIMPALIDLYHPVTVSGLSTATASRTIVFNGRTFTIPGSRSTSAPSYVKLSDVVDPLSLKNDLHRLARNGVGRANIVTRGYGQSIVVRVAPDEASSAVVQRDGSLYLSLTNSTASLNVLRSGLKGRTSSRSSSGTAARSSSAASSTSSSSSAARSSSSSSSTAASSTGSNSTAALWASVKEGKSPIILNVNNSATILYVLQIKKEFSKARMVIVASGEDLYRVLDQLKGKKVSVLIKAGIDVAPRSNQRINMAQLLDEAGIEFGFSSSLDGSLATMPDTPLFPVSQLVKTGLSDEMALKALTANPAKMLGLEKSLGSIEVGKKANLLFLNGSPIDAATTVQQLLVEGESIYENK